MSMLKKIREYNSPKNVMRRIDAFSEFSKKMIPILIFLILLITFYHMLIILIEHESFYLLRIRS